MEIDEQEESDSILAKSVACVPSNWTFGNPLYHSTNDRAPATFFNFSPEILEEKQQQQHKTEETIEYCEKTSKGYNIHDNEFDRYKKIFFIGRLEAQTPSFDPKMHHMQEILHQMSDAAHQEKHLYQG